MRYVFYYVLYKYISRRTDHLSTTIYSRYPIHSVKALYYKNSSNMSLIADVRINNQYIRVINNHFETTSVNAYRGIITAPGKSLEVRAKAVKDLVLKMKSNYLKRAEQADSIHAEIERSPYPYWFVATSTIRPLLIHTIGYRKVWQMVSVIVEVVTNIPSVSYTNSGGLITFSIRNRWKVMNAILLKHLIVTIIWWFGKE